MKNFKLLNIAFPLLVSLLPGCIGSGGSSAGSTRDVGTQALRTSTTNASDRVAAPVLESAASPDGSAFSGGQVLRHADGSAFLMNQFDAVKFCPAGTHLPTARELAKISQSRGAKGILEVNEVSPELVPPGYSLISAVNPDGQRDDFYFNPEGYKEPDGVVDQWPAIQNGIDHDLWSSSVNYWDCGTADGIHYNCPAYNSWPTGTGFFLTGFVGGFARAERDVVEKAVFCVQ